MLTALEARQVTLEYKKAKEYYVEQFYITTFSMIYRAAQDGLSRVVALLPHEDRIGHVVTYKDVTDTFIELGYVTKPINTTSIEISW